MTRTKRNRTKMEHWQSGGPSDWSAALLLAFFIGVVYVPAVNTPFIFDDLVAITQNDSIVSLWPLVGFSKPGPLNPPPEHPTSGRPLVNLSFAINHQIGGLNPIGYHVFNVMLHFCNAMLVWALARRTLRLAYFKGTFDRSAEWLALAVAMLWALHPLQTEAVIYATQRTELMMALFYLATLYCSLRSWTYVDATLRKRDDADARKPPFVYRLSKVWPFLAVLACLCGMASKEVMVSAPLIVLLFERTFVAGSLLGSLRRSWQLYVGLALTWLLLASLVMTGPRVDSAGFHLGIPPHVWWFTQSRVLFMYLRLAIWPWPLLIHYELPYVTFAEAWLYVVPLSFIGLLTFVLLLRNRPLGFLGTWFFVILAPTFVIPVVTEMAAERRMYLALVPLAVIFVVGGYRLAGFVAARLGSSQPRSQFPLHSLVSGGIAAALALIFCFVSATRLAAYESETTLWLQVLQSQPENPRAHLYVANLLESQGKIDDAVEEYRETIRLHPNPVQAHYRLGLLLNKTGAHDEAAAELGKAIRGLPNKSAAMQNDLGVALYMAGRNDEAIQAYRDTLAIDPDFWPAHRNLGTALQKAGKLQEATKSFETALRLNPKTFDVYFDLANAHSQLNQPPQAIAALERGLAAAQAANDVKAVEKFSAELKAKNR